MTTVTHDDSGSKHLTAALKDLQSLSAKVGWFENAKYPNGEQIAYIATIQEYGYEPKNIPPRMGLRALLPEKRGEWAGKLEILARKVLAGKMPAFDALEAFGGKVRGDIFKHIASVTSPPLAFATQAARARRRGIPADELTATGAKPLNDTGLMIASLTHITESSGK